LEVVGLLRREHPKAFIPFQAALFANLATCRLLARHRRELRLLDRPLRKLSAKHPLDNRSRSPKTRHLDRLGGILGHTDM
jgi:hypothetical protein